MSEKWQPLRISGTNGETAQIQEHLREKSTEDLTQELDDFLDQSTDLDMDIGLLDEYLKIIGEREDFPEFDVENSWFRFERAHQDLLEMEASAEQQSSASDSVSKRKKSRRVKPIQIFLTVAAIVAMLMVASSCGVIDYIIHAIAGWTDEVFYYDVTGFLGEQTIAYEDTETEHYDSLEEALRAYGVGTECVPKWYPEGFACNLVNILDTSDTIKFRAEYICGEKYVGLTIRQFKGANALELNALEKNPAVEIYESGGIQHYIMKNNATINVTWITGTEMYTIAGDLSTEEAKRMIDSAYEGQE